MRSKEEVLRHEARLSKLLEDGAKAHRQTREKVEQAKALLSDYLDQESGPGVSPGVRRGLDMAAKVLALLDSGA